MPAQRAEGEVHQDDDERGEQPERRRAADRGSGFLEVDPRERDPEEHRADGDADQQPDDGARAGHA